MSNVYLDNVNADMEGFQRINAVLSDAQKVWGERIVLCMRGRWFNASMSAALYAVLKRVQESHKVYLHQERDASVERILSKNGFFPYLIDMEQAFDTYGTTIPFKVFDKHDEDLFNDYVDTSVTHHHSFPAASEALKREINKSLLELFVNARMHANSRHAIASCGQFFPRKNLLEICLADAGIGIHGNVRRLEPDITDAEAIEWAMQEGHTTRNPRHGVPGGLGLKLLREFIELNKGRLILVSGYGYLEVNASGMRTQAMQHLFPGTVAHVVIRTDDLGYYDVVEDAPTEDELF